jgi:hypothetical protein
MKTKKTNSQGLKVTHSPKSQKITDYIYVLSNGDQLIFKDKNFPQKKSLIQPNGQLLMF